MTADDKHDTPILVTGAAGAVGGVGRTLTELLLARGHRVRAMVRREDERAEALRQLGAEVVQGDLTDLYDRMTDTVRGLTGQAPTNMHDVVTLHAAEFKQRGPAQ